MKTKLILCLFLILLLLFILRIKKETFKDSEDNVQIKSPSYPFDSDVGCDSIYYDGKYPMHINNELFKKNIPKIHLVNPYNPCCLRTCINDFTYTPENSNSSTEYGKLKSFISNDSDNLDTLYVSQCDQCIKNFSKAIKILNTGNKCSKIP